MTDGDATRLLEAIAADRLVLIGGAGLSIPPPSSLPTAAAVAAKCVATYKLQTGNDLPPAFLNDVEAVARHFRQDGRFESTFIGTLVPWSDFHREPNHGHEAIADFLACGVLLAGVTTNFDCLVESAAMRMGEPDFRAIVGDADLTHKPFHRPFLKAHGCATRSRNQTVWCREQLGADPVKQTMKRFIEWLAPMLFDRDVLFVGFWSDWEYLTDLLIGALPVGRPQHVYLVDPADDAVLEAKAPGLWKWAHQSEVILHRIQESGADVIDDLRRRWSRVFLARLQDDAKQSYQALFGEAPKTPPHGHLGLDSRALYALRRDLTGTPRTAPSRDRVPNSSDHIAAALHRRIIDRGATYVAEHVHELGGRRLRIVSGRGQVLSAVKAQFEHEPPLSQPVERVICAGAFADFAPVNIVRGGGTPTIVRGAPSSTWMTHDNLAAELR
jgi:hypothetical protein